MSRRRYNRTYSFGNMVWLYIWVALLAFFLTMRLFDKDRSYSVIDPSRVAIASYRTEPGQHPDEVRQTIKTFFGKYAESATKVAICESGLNPYAKNKNSTATGVLQIIRGTWEGYKCDGERTNAVDNIRCGFKIFVKNGYRFNTTGGWSASHACHQQP